MPFLRAALLRKNGSQPEKPKPPVIVVVDEEFYGQPEFTQTPAEITELEILHRLIDEKLEHAEQEFARKIDVPIISDVVVDDVAVIPEIQEEGLDATGFVDEAEGLPDFEEITEDLQEPESFPEELQTEQASQELPEQLDCMEDLQNITEPEDISEEPQVLQEPDNISDDLQEQPEPPEIPEDLTTEREPQSLQESVDIPEDLQDTTDHEDLPEQTEADTGPESAEAPAEQQEPPEIPEASLPEQELQNLQEDIPEYTREISATDTANTQPTTEAEQAQDSETDFDENSIIDEAAEIQSILQVPHEITEAVAEPEPEEFKLKYDVTSGERYVDTVSTKTEFDKMLDELSAISGDLLSWQVEKFAKQYTGKFQGDVDKAEADAKKYEAFLGGYITNAAMTLYDNGYRDAAIKRLEQARSILEARRKLEDETLAIKTRVEEDNDAVDLSDILGMFGDG